MGSAMSSATIIEIGNLYVNGYKQHKNKVHSKVHPSVPENPPAAPEERIETGETDTLLGLGRCCKHKKKK